MEAFGKPYFKAGTGNLNGVPLRIVVMANDSKTPVLKRMDNLGNFWIVVRSGTG